MSAGASEQRNPYKGMPERPWIRLRLLAPDGTAREIEMVADTGNPYAVIIGTVQMQQFKWTDAPGLTTNFGPLDGGWIRIVIPELGLDRYVLGYASDAVVAATQMSSHDFEGLVGLPLLQFEEYGGNAAGFWLRVSGSP